MNPNERTVREIAEGLRMKISEETFDTYQQAESKIRELGLPDHLYSLDNVPHGKSYGWRLRWYDPTKPVCEGCDE